MPMHYWLPKYSQNQSQWLSVLANKLNYCLHPNSCDLKNEACRCTLFPRKYQSFLPLLSITCNCFFTNLLHSPKETPKKSDYYFMFTFRYIIKYPLHTQVTMLQLQCQGYCGNFRLEIRGLACASPWTSCFQSTKL